VAFGTVSWGDGRPLVLTPLRVILPFFILTIDVSVLFASAVFLFSLLGLLFRVGTSPPLGIPLQRTEHATLYELIDRLCKRLSVRPPDAVYLSPFEETGITDESVECMDGAAQRPARALLLGTGHIVRLRADEFATVVCHEIAHASMGDTRFASLATRFFGVMGQALETLLDDPNLLSLALAWPLRVYYRVFAWLYLMDSRRREFRADRLAALVCGPQNTRNALMKTCLPSYLPQFSIGSLFAEFCQNERDIRNIYQEHRIRWSQLPTAAIDRAQSQMFLESGSTWSTHPPFAQRMRNVSELSAKELVIDRPATRLFKKWDELEEHMTRALISVGRAVFEEHLNRLDRELRSSGRT